MRMAGWRTAGRGNVEWQMSVSMNTQTAMGGMGNQTAMGGMRDQPWVSNHVGVSVAVIVQKTENRKQRILKKFTISEDAKQEPEL